MHVLHPACYVPNALLQMHPHYNKAITLLLKKNEMIQFCQKVTFLFPTNKAANLHFHLLGIQTIFKRYFSAFSNKILKKSQFF